MHAWEQIQNTINYIEEHLDEPIEVEQLAQIASLSPFYYQRLFSQLVKKPVVEYIRHRRMAKAMLLLRQQDMRILDIALHLGFASHEHFTRTFKNTFGMTPTQYRKHPIPLNTMTKPELSLQYSLVNEGEWLIVDGMVLEIERKQLIAPIQFIGLEKKMPVQFVEGLGIASGVDPLDTLWRRFHKEKVKILGMSEEAEEIGVSYPSEEPAYFLYFAGAKEEKEKQIHGYTNYVLTQGEYIVCSFEAENFESLVMDALYKAQQYLFTTWLRKFDIQTEPFCAERYSSHSSKTRSMELWLKIIQ